jgi:hypothetical protein
MMVSVFIVLTDYYVAMFLSVNSKAPHSDTDFYTGVVSLVVSDTGIWGYCLYYDFTIDNNIFHYVPLPLTSDLLSFVFSQNQELLALHFKKVGS